MHGKFTWVDLSTFDVSKAKQFYSSVFSWGFTGDDSEYNTCSRSGNACAGIYEMPKFFQEIRMPSFWMTYIAVDDVDSVVAKVGSLGGKVELEEDSPMGRVALIRDPSGAGFTCIEGGKDSGGRESGEPGSWCWTELVISDASLVQNFYTALFSWKIEPKAKDRYEIRTSSGSKIGAIQVADENIKGAKEFWAVYFAVSDLHGTLHTIEESVVTREASILMRMEFRR